MNKRLYLIVIAFLLSIANSFALIADRLEIIFDKGGLLDTVVGSPYIIGSLFYIAILISFQKIFTIAVSPLFRGNNKEAKTVGFSISFIGTTGLFYIFTTNGGSIEYLVGAIGAYAAFFMIFLVLAGTMRIIDQSMSENGRFENPRWRAAIGLGLFLSASFLSAFLIKVAIDTDGEVIKILQDILATIITGAIILLLSAISIGGAGGAGFLAWKGAKTVTSRRKDVLENPDYSLVFNKIGSVNDRFVKINRTLKDLNKEISKGDKK